MNTVIHPGYIQAVKSKPTFPAAIYAYPKFVRNIGPRQRPLQIPAPMLLPASTAALSLRGLSVVYAALGLVVWVVAAIAPMGF